MQQLPLVERIDRVTQHISRARIFLDLWLFFEEDTSRRKVLATMQDFGEFFRFAPHAFFTSYVIYIAGAFDRTRGTISLNRIVAEMKKSGALSSASNAKAEALLLRAAPIITKVALLRSNALAHRSAHITYNQVFDDAAVMPSQLRELTDTALEIANLLLISQGRTAFEFSALPREDAGLMMRALARSPR